MSEENEPRPDGPVPDGYRYAGGGLFVTEEPTPLVESGRTLAFVLAVEDATVGAEVAGLCDRIEELEAEVKQATLTRALLREALTLAAGLPDANRAEWRGWIAQAQRSLLIPTPPGGEQ